MVGARVIRLSSSGDTLWAGRYAVNGRPDPKVVIATPNHGYLVSGAYWALSDRSRERPFAVQFSTDSTEFRVPERSAGPPTSDLLSIYPNPFNSTARMSFTPSRRTDVTLEVYDVTGRLVETIAEGVFEAGEHGFRMTSDRLASGVYFVRLQGGGETRVAKMVMMK